MINLLPPHIKEDIAYGRRNVQLRWYVGLIIIMTVSLVGALFAADWYARQELNRLDDEHLALRERLTPIESVTEESKAIQTKLNTLGELFKKETNYVSLLEDIEAVIVPGAQLQRLELTGNESEALEMEFIINDKLTAATLRNSLEASHRFSFVDIQSIDETSRDDRIIISATYKLTYEPGMAR